MEKEIEEMIPRNYQVALYQKCIESNTIIFLPTGTGKTFIAIMVLKKMGGDLLGEDHKISIILVNTVALVDQHTKYIQQHTPFKCAGYSGEMNVDLWRPEMWQEQFQKYQVLVMTAEILAVILRSQIFNLSKINLLIFDECHHGVHDHSMRKLMLNFQNLSNPPKVIGLTATLLNGNCKSENIMDEVRSLEVTFHSKVATVDGLETVVGYATNPKEFLIVYEDDDRVPVINKCVEYIDEVILIIGMLKLEPYLDKRLRNPNLVPLSPEDGFKKVVNMLNDLIFHLLNFGVYGGKFACLAYQIHIERLKKHSEMPKLLYSLNYIQTVLSHVILLLTKEMSDCKSEKDRFWKYSSKKVLKLIEVLDLFKKNSDENLCGLIFVERRFTAKVLYHILDELSKIDPDYSYIRPDFIIGNNNNLSLTRENLYITKKNRQVLDGFCNKEINLLCTSQVLEEGIDIPKCTLVCKFDHPKDYRSYIQSKGRARHQKSHYYMLVSEKNLSKYIARYEEYQQVERILNNFLVGKNDERDAPSQVEIESMYNDVELPNYYVKGPGSAYISDVSAVTLLTRYCQSLSSDQFTVHSPEWFIEQINVNGKGICCVVTIYLPTVCPITEPIKGCPMKSKKGAKRAAAYFACIKLHQCGELTDHLQPVERVVREKDVSFLFGHHPKEKEVGAGLKKIRTYDTHVPKATLGNILPQREVFLHVINFEPKFYRANDDINMAAIYDMYASDLTYGFLTPNKLPPTCNFPIYVSNGTIIISIANNINTLVLSERQIKKIREFHYTVFDDVLDILSSFLVVDISEQAEAIFLVPVRKTDLQIDFGIIENNRTIKSYESTLNHSEKLGLEVDDETYLHKIVIPTYRRDLPTYLVTRVCYEMSPATEFPQDTFKDFSQYYMDVHQVRIVNQKQPLLFVKRLSQKLNMYKPEGLEKKRKKERCYEQHTEYLIPEILVKQEFPAPLWIQGFCLPTILSRLSYILRLQELWQKIGQDCQFKLEEDNMKPLEMNLNLIRYNPVIDEQTMKNNMKKNYESSEGIPALPSSLKSTSYNKDFQNKVLESKYPWKDLDEPKDINRSLNVTVMDIEAYETFVNFKVSGNERKDVHKSPVKNKYLALTYDKEFVEKSIQLLKMKGSGTVQLTDLYEALTTSKANDIVNLERLETLGDSFLKYVVTFYIMLKFPKFDEGRATSLKGRLISNKNLFYLAKMHNVGGIMKNRDLMPQREWLPPGFCIPEQLRKGISGMTTSVSALFRCDFSREERSSGCVNERIIENVMEEYPLNSEEDTSYQNMDQFLRQQCLKDKCVADVIEAILGVYLLHTGISGCLKVLHWISIIPPSENLEEFFQKPSPNPIIKEGAQLKDISFHLPLFHQIEEILGYNFKNRGYLLQALTHASYSPNRITQSYERLEFLGDAVLDLLITCFIYESSDNLTPGDLTDLRSSLVNNNIFASYVVRLGLHRYLLMMNSKLQSHIDRFVSFMTMKNYEIDDEVLILLQEEDMNMADCVDVPKVLGDIFEALAGAVFLDSGYNLETVWKVLYKIMWREIDNFSKNIPKNVVRRLFESVGAYPDFGKAQPTHNNRVMVKLHFHAQGRPKFVYGFGSNKILAKKAAAKIALQYLKDQ